MNKIYSLVAGCIILLNLSGCGDNSYNGKDGLLGQGGSKTSVQQSVDNIYKKVILHDANASYSQSLTLIDAVEDMNSSLSKASLLKAREEFKMLALSYKKVETTFVAGIFSDDMRDIAEFNIEQFIKHSKSQDIAGDLDAVFSGQKGLVSSSLKGITALEYTLFGDAEDVNTTLSKMNQIRRDSAIIMAKSISDNLQKINDFYKTDTTFETDSNKAIDALLNVFVNNAFLLRENRIGNPAGLTSKFQGNPDKRRLEYYRSSNSLAAIKVILQTQKRVMNNGLMQISIDGNARSEADAIVEILDDSLIVADSYTGTLAEELTSSKTKALYNNAKNLQNNYTALISALNFTQKIVEADGD